MKQTFRKLKILVGMLKETFRHWRNEVWKRDLDELHCCTGQMMDQCACGGITVGEAYGERS
jgi:hypothetical protein